VLDLHAKNQVHEFKKFDDTRLSPSCSTFFGRFIALTASTVTTNKAQVDPLRNVSSIYWCTLCKLSVDDELAENKISFELTKIFSMSA
jgi:hypothetical protein